MNYWRITLLMTLILSFTGFHTAMAAADYYLDVGDKISINVYDEEMDVEVRLGSSGSFQFPFLGLITAKGKSLEQLGDEITRKLRDGYLVNPQVRVHIEEYRPLYINGEVRSPGAYPYQLGLTLRKAISLAGGYNDNADKDKTVVIRNNVEQKLALNAPVYPGDIIAVEQSFFFMNGEVKSPGKYPFKSGLTIRMAVSLAGGFSERASESNIIVLHEADKGEKPKDIELDSDVLAGDIITVKQSFF